MASFYQYFSLRLTTFDGAAARSRPLCVCVCVCVRARVRACACFVDTSVLLIQAIAWFFFAQLHVPVYFTVYNIGRCRYLTTIRPRLDHY